MPTLKGFVYLPEQFLRHGRVACLVPMGKAVPARRRASPNLRKSAGMFAKPVAYVVQAQPMGQMGVQHGDHMAVSTEGTRLYPILPGKVSYDFRKLEKVNAPSQE